MSDDDSTFTGGAEKGTGADLQAVRSGVPTKVLSVRAPWWWWIVQGYKPIENRDWPTTFRGPVWIHASKWWRQKDFVGDMYAALRMSGHVYDFTRHPDDEYVRSHGGHIVGRADIVDCVSESDSPWFVGKFGFVLANARPITPILCKGALGFFTAPPDVLAALRREATATLPVGTPAKTNLADEAQQKECP